MRPKIKCYLCNAKLKRSSGTSNMKWYYCSNYNGSSCTARYTFYEGELHDVKFYKNKVFIFAWHDHAQICIPKTNDPDEPHDNVCYDVSQGFDHFQDMLKEIDLIITFS